MKSSDDTKSSDAAKEGTPSPSDEAATVQPTEDERAEADAAREEELWEECRELAEKEDILDAFISDLKASGFVGQEREATLLYLIFTSRLLPRPMCAVVKGISSAGKSFLVEKVSAFFPSSAYYALTSMSDKALLYMEEPLEHRILIIGEAAGLSSGTLSYLLRCLISEGRITHVTVSQTRNKGWKGRVMDREGPTGLVVTTTRVSLDRELETRLFSIPMDDSGKQTRAIFKAIAGAESKRVDLSRWHALHNWLALGNRRVEIPYAQDLADKMHREAVRLRRDFSHVLTLIRVHALLHQASREVDEEGRVVATIEDYRAVYPLIVDLISQGVGATVSPIIRETVDAVANLAGKSETPVRVIDVAGAIGRDKSVAWRRIQAAIKEGYLRNDETRKGQPARLFIADPLPEERKILPLPEELE